MTTDLAALARAAVARNTDGGHSSKLRAVRDLCSTHQETGAAPLKLSEYVAAVKDAMANPPLDLDHVARAVLDALTEGIPDDTRHTWDNISDRQRDYYRTCARAALAAVGVVVAATKPATCDSVVVDDPAGCNIDARLDAVRAKLANEPGHECNDYCTEFEHHNL